jgi:hypothetical protein
MFTRTVIGVDNRRETPVYWGYGTPPFSIDAPSRRYPILHVALLGDEPTLIDGDAVATRARNLAIGAFFVARVILPTVRP